MKTINRLQNKNQKGWLWFLNWFSRFDSSKLSSFSISDKIGNSQFGISGLCSYPKVKKGKFKIRARVNVSEYPYCISVRRPPIYKIDGIWPNIPSDCIENGWKKNFQTGKEWIKLVSSTQVNNLDESIVWICAHEIYHYLRKTKQVPGRNVEIMADAFADNLLEEFRNTQLTR